MQDTTNINPFRIEASSTLLNALGFTPTYDFNQIQLTHVSNSVVTLGNSYSYIHVTTDLVKTYYSKENVDYLATLPISSIPAGTSSYIQFPDIKYVASKSFFQTFTMSLKDLNFNLIDNNNSDYMIAIKLVFF
jgi:hypothetical protein